MRPSRTTYIPGMPVRAGIFRTFPIVTLGLSLLLAASSFAGEPALNKPPTLADWLRLSRLPDWSGVWNPNISDQNAQIKANPVPWKPSVRVRIEQLAAEERAGRPRGLFVDCLVRFVNFPDPRTFLATLKYQL